MSEIDILKATIQDLKSDNLILKQTLLQAQKEYSDKNVMTLRDHFAGLAMQGLLSADLENKWDEEDCAEFAYQQADAMLKERSKSDE
jgi:hypothetical protein